MKSRILLPFLAFLLTSSVSAAPLPAPPGLIGWWPGEAGGAGLVAAPAAALTEVVPAAGQNGAAWQFTNTATATPTPSRGFIPDSPLMRLAAFTITLWCWFDVPDTAGTWDEGLQYLLFQRGSGLFEAWSLCKLRDDSNGRDQLLFTFGPASSDRFGLSSSLPAGVQMNTWYFVAAVFDNTVARLYINGTEVSSFATGFEIGYRSFADTWLASSGQTFDGRFGGRMDELCLYQRVLAAAEIAALRQAEDGIFLPDDTMLSFQPGGTALTWAGHWGRLYRVESSPNLTSWSQIGFLLNGNGANSLTPGPAASPQQFYRVNRVP